MTRSALNISEAAGLAIHAVTVIARRRNQPPVKLTELAQAMGASVTHLGKVMQRLAVAGIVSSRRGPSGGFVIGSRAPLLTLLDIKELFDGPTGCKACLLGHDVCPFGSCVLGEVVQEVDTLVRHALGDKRIAEL